MVPTSPLLAKGGQPLVNRPWPGRVYRGKKHERELATIWDVGLLRRCISENGSTHERWRAFHAYVLQHLRLIARNGKFLETWREPSHYNIYYYQ